MSGCTCVRLEPDPGLSRYSTVTAVQRRPSCPVHGAQAEPDRWATMAPDDQAAIDQADDDTLLTDLRRSVP